MVNHLDIDKVSAFTLKLCKGLAIFHGVLLILFYFLVDVLHEEEALFGLKTKKGDFDIHVKRTK